MKKMLYIIASFMFALSTYAATPLNMRHQPLFSLQSLTEAHSQLKPISRTVDFNQTTHVHYQQLYDGYPIWGSAVVQHFSTTSASHTSAAAPMRMNGIVYQNLRQDLQQSPAYIFNDNQKNKAMQFIKNLYQQQKPMLNITQLKCSLMVFIDADFQAHWAFVIGFSASKNNVIVEQPHFIIDALTFMVYKQWDDLHTYDSVTGGGFGGNPKTQKITYNTLSIERDPKRRLCYLENDLISVKDIRKRDALVQFKCAAMDKTTQVFWDDALDSVNGGYSPSNDALYAGEIVSKYYQQFYKIPVLAKSSNQSPLKLNFKVHDDDENAYFDAETQSMVLGDGGNNMYPLTSVGVVAHELSHGFTAQHSNLIYYGESGGLNESFSDMAAQALEFYQHGKNSWQIGAEIMKRNIALRYMDNPKKDCSTTPKGSMCSIDHVKDYYDGLNVHFSSGIFNRAFYLLSTRSGWTTQKAFDVMVQANRHYWTAGTNFLEAACGVMDAAKDYAYDTDAVSTVMMAVGIDVKQC